MGPFPQTPSDERPLLWPTLLFLMLVVLVTAVGIVGDRNLGALADGFSRVAHSHAVLNELAAVHSGALAAQSASRGFRMSGDRSFLDECADATERARLHRDRLGGMIGARLAQQQQHDSLIHETEDLFEFLDEVDDAALGAASRPVRRRSARSGQELMRRIDARVERMRAAELEHLVRRARQADETYLLARLAGGALAAVTLPLGVLVYVLFARTMRAKSRETFELRQRGKDLADADRRKDEFLAMLGHELRNPLAPIRMALHVLDHEHAPPSALARAREIIDRQVAQMSRLVDDLMDVSRVALGKLSLRRTTTDLRTVARAAAEATQPVIIEHGHRFELVLPPGPIAVAVDPTRMQQVLQNLLVNAAKYTDRGGVIRLELVVEGSRRDAVLRVTDTGRGLTAEELSRIFSAFEQGESAGERGEGGIGIGLTLARRLVEMHGGSLAAKSPGPGLGSTFEVRLSRRTF